MSESDPHIKPKGINWSAWLALTFLFLFALLWSLGPFFFWVPLSLAGYFGFLAIYSSSSLREFAEKFSSSFQQGKPPVTNPYQTIRSRRPSPPQPPGTVSPRRIVLVVMLFLGSLFLFFVIVGIIVGVNDDTGDAEAVSPVEDTEEDDGTSYWIDKGTAAVDNKLYDSAHYYLDQALKIDGENMYALYNKGLAFILTGNYPSGNALARRCVYYHPDYDQAWWLLGYSYDLTHNTDSSLYCLEKAFDNGFNNPDFLELTGEVYLKKGKNGDALAVYQKLVDTDTTRGAAWLKLAELDPSNAAYYQKKARALGN